MPDQVSESVSETGSRPAGDDPFAASLRGFGPVGILTMLAIVLGNGLLGPFRTAPVLLWAWRSRTPWREIGLAFGIAFKPSSNRPQPARR